MQAAVLSDVLDVTETVVRGVQPDQFGLPTPCPGYDVGSVVNHIVGWIGVFAAGAAGQPVPDPASYASDGDPGGDFHVAARQAVDAFEHGAAERPINLGNGDSPGSMVFGMMLIEYIGHAWDLAIATGQTVAFSDQAIAEAQEATDANLLPQYRGPDKSFGDIVAVPDDATPLERLLGSLGRHPDWMPRS